MPPQNDQQSALPSSGPQHPQCWAMILAGGSGERLGSSLPKAFVDIFSKPMLAWSILSFAAHEAITDILVVVPKGYRDEFSQKVLGAIKKELGGLNTRIHKPVVGGSRRQDSSRAGLTAILAQTDESRLENLPILIHDAARPIVRPRVISQLLDRLQIGLYSKPGVVAAIPALPVGDTLKTGLPGGVDSSGGKIHRVNRTISREGLYQIQTPQAFCLGPILEAHNDAMITSYQATDDAMLFERMNWPVEIVQGSRLSLKITYPDDLALIEGWLRQTAQSVGESNRQKRPEKPQKPSRKSTR